MLKKLSVHRAFEFIRKAQEKINSSTTNDSQHADVPAHFLSLDL